MRKKKIFGREKRLISRANRSLLRQPLKRNKKPVLFLVSPSGQAVRA